MERQAVVSSNVETIGYDAANGVVEVEFKGGRIYHYLGVDQSTWDSREEAESIGRWVAQALKPVHEVIPGEFEAPEAEEPEVDVEAEIEARREDEQEYLDSLEEEPI